MLSLSCFFFACCSLSVLNIVTNKFEFCIVELHIWCEQTRQISLRDLVTEWVCLRVLVLLGTFMPEGFSAKTWSLLAFYGLHRTSIAPSAPAQRRARKLLSNEPNFTVLRRCFDGSTDVMYACLYIIQQIMTIVLPVSAVRMNHIIPSRPQVLERN